MTLSPAWLEAATQAVRRMERCHCTAKTWLSPFSSHPRVVSPAESAGHCSREELAGDSCQHPDNNRGGLPSALPGAGEEEGKAGGGGL